MKLTNRENSIKLFELGFRAPYEGGHIKNIADEEMAKKHGIVIAAEFYPKYDLETLIEALPDSIEDAGYYYFFMNKTQIGYCDSCQDYYYSEYGEEITMIKTNSESLADTAARLLIQLIEQDIIKTGDKHE